MAQSYRDTDGEADAGQAPADFTTVKGKSGEAGGRRRDAYTFGLTDGILVVLVVLLLLSYAY